MASTLPYLSSYKNVGALFERIAAARIPDAFSQPYLYQTLGLKGKQDRSLIPLLRTLGFIDAAGRPAAEYSALKNPSFARAAIARAVKRAYAPLFEANENAHRLSADELKGLVAQVAGSDVDMTAKIVGTFNSLVRLADFESAAPRDEERGDDSKATEDTPDRAKDQSPAGVLRTEFHYNIQVHLPSNATEDIYLSIFNALRRAMQ